MLIDDKWLLLGIRHHGPGSTASMLRALESFQPDCLLIEGAPEAEQVLSFLDSADWVPPVAQLIYAPDDARDSVFYPFTEFSPEWQGIKFARARSLPVTLMDLPQTHQLALVRQRREASIENDEASPEHDTPTAPPPLDSLDLRVDPLDLLARAAGFEDGERWWEHVVEQHPQDMEVFAAIGEAMTVLREKIEAETPLSLREARREAWMRRAMRNASKEGFQRVAVICGAWHVPALIRKVPVKEDDALLKALPKIKLQCTWIPWSNGRISYRSGYGAGVASPGWYAHLWQHNHNGQREAIAASWLTKAARVLREEGFEVAPANVIEAVRLANTLAALRDCPLPSLREMNEAIQTLFCFGETTPLALLQQKLIIGECLGKIPEGLPKVPLQEDIAALQKRLRLKVSAASETIELDLRKEMDLERSTLLHRLRILGITWGYSASSRGGRGTFKEIWQLRWQPEFELQLIEQSVWGNRVVDAVHAFAQSSIAKTTELADVTEWIDRLLLADLPQTMAVAIAQLQTLSAVGGDIGQLMQALPRLSNIARYGDVRGTDNQALLHLVDGFCERIIIGLPNFSRQIDEQEAVMHATQMQSVNDALKLLANADHLNDWWLALQRVAESESAQPIIRGRCYRLLLNAQAIDMDHAENALRVALSAAQEPLHAAQWVEGLLAGSGLLLVHDDRLWSLLDDYICTLDESRFLTVLPLLRRTFINFTPSEREQLRDKAQHSGQPIIPSDRQDFDYAEILPSVPLLYRMLGLPPLLETVDP